MVARVPFPVLTCGRNAITPLVAGGDLLVARRGEGGGAGKGGPLWSLASRSLSSPCHHHQTSPGIFTHRPRLFYIRVVNFTGS